MKSWLWTAVALPLAACSLIEEPEPDLTERPPVLFEIEYFNQAALPRWRGYYIDSAGELYSYDRSNERTGPTVDQSAFTHAELMEKVDPGRTRVRAVSRTELQALSLLIPAAARGEITTTNRQCADAGVLSFLAYIFDHNALVFRKVVIRNEGDVARANQANEARQIYQYLDGLRLVQHISGCEP
ncbi:MAG: hypothetical protein ACRENP_04985 [Longimicrobiales bacterium]